MNSGRFFAVMFIAASSCQILGGAAVEVSATLERNSNRVILQWPSVATRSYQVRTATQVTGPWSILPTEPPALVAVTNLLSYDLRPDGNTGFFQVVEVETEPANPNPQQLVWIPSGTFLMGSPASESRRKSSEGPQTTVTISKGFWLGKYEVTQREYEDVMGVNPSYFKGDPDYPVERVSWNESTNYCGKLTARELAAGRLPVGYEYRLPTEAQWEYACRAGTTTATGFGNSLSSTQANFDGNLPYNGAVKGPKLGTTTKVGTYLGNAWGLHDMHGNVWEWCQDWYGFYPGGSVRDPTGLALGTDHVIRGGCWGNDGTDCRSAARSWRFSDFSNLYHGFRVALVQIP